MPGIALFGGTFNPIHNGHISMITEIAKLDFIDTVLVLPDNIPPHKNVGFLADSSQRIEMCRLATKSIKKVKIDTSEIMRGGKSYSFDTVSSFKNIYPNDKLYFVCGGDMLLTLETWYKAQELFKLCSFICFGRSGIDEAVIKEKINMLNCLGADIIYINTPIMSVSSTELREKISLEMPLETLLPESIIKYIKDNNIYR